LTRDVNPALQAALAGLGRFHPTSIDLSLGRIESRLAALGNPERRLPPIFHVAGTNGKGSTVAFLRSFLEAAGYRCHVYTSPHLVRFNERIRLAGELIDDDQLISLIDEVEKAAPDEPITTFEMTTAIALLAFSRVSADATLIEVGLGGRYDATNLFTRPYATAVTRISFDHRQFLGNSLGGIAGEKAGIFKTGTPAIVADQPADEARGVLIRESNAVGAPLFLHGAEWRVSPLASGFRYEGPGRSLDLPPPGLAGQHQFMNAGTALTMLDAGNSNAGGGFAIDDDAVRRGLGAVYWPGRLQRLKHGPLVESLSPNWELWLDGAHNDSCGEVLSVQAQSWCDRPLDLVFGMLESKVPQELLQPLAPHVGRLRAVAIPDEPGSLSAAAAAAAAREAGIADSRPLSSVAEAVAALSQKGRAGRILICGSLYLAGAVLADNG
jgi:dihydrofolate synthase/folylpolyglutamate synthase